MVARIKSPQGRRLPKTTAAEPKPPPTARSGKLAKPSTHAGWAPLDKAAADKTITNAEWKTVAGSLNKAGWGSPEGRRLLEVYADKAVSFELGAATDAHQALHAKGFDMPPRKEVGAGRTAAPDIELAHVIDGNVAEADHTFDRLASVVGTAGPLPIAVIDGGFVAHEILRDNLAGPTSSDGEPIGKQIGEFTTAERQAGAHHGTHVAGIATRGTPRIQASLYAIPLEVPDDPHAASKKKTKERPLLQALEAAAKQGASVINVSIETFVTPAEAKRYQQLLDKHPNTLFVFGAGNDAYELGTQPGGDTTLAETLKRPNMVVVGASNPNGGRWGQSNTSATWVDLAARGHAINSASENGGLIMASGTSMAAPNVSNLAAKLRMLNPSLSPAQLTKLMSLTSDPHVSWKDQVASGGTVNNDRAMNAAAALALVRGGLTLALALDRLAVPTSERPAIVKALEKFAAH